ncbi:hypothetical protein ACHAXT_004251 [Thalassiosira profunda]
MMDSLISPKRQKTSADAGLASLPDGVLASVGEYLALPSRVLFSVALTAPSSSSWAKRHWIGGPSAVGHQAVVPPGSVTTLDFEEIDEDLAVRLSDDDLGAVLAILDAGRNLHKLKLANCLNITGRGLEPLRGSTALQFVDLSLVGQFVKVPEIENPEVEGGVLSVAIVTPVLQSIIDAEGSALRYLALPHKWRAALSEPLALFHRNYAQHLYDKSQPCAKENCHNPVGVHRMRRCRECSEQPCVCYSAWFGHFRMGGGFQDYSCYECGSMYCESCNDHLEPLNYCDCCEKNYCTKHLSFDGCDACETTNCSGCRSTVECSECGLVRCSKCEPDFTSHGEQTRNTFTCAECKAGRRLHVNVAGSLEIARIQRDIRGND